MDLGNGVALAGLCLSGGAVAITAIRTFGRPSVNGKNGLPGKNGKNGTCPPCAAHSGVIVALEERKENNARLEKWMETISEDVKELLKK